MGYIRYGFYMMVGAMVASLMVTIGMSWLDANNHYYYVGFLQKECWGSNQFNPQGNPNQICVDAWNNLGIPVGDQGDIPQKYNTALNQTLYLIAGAIGVIYLTSMIIQAKVFNRPPDAIKFYMIFVVMATVSLPVLSGVGDYFYFLWLGLPEPTTWQWLDGAGIFPFILQQTHEQHVSLNDMYIAMSVGIIGIVAFWTPILLAFNSARKRTIKDII